MSGNEAWKAFTLPEPSPAADERFMREAMALAREAGSRRRSPGGRRGGACG